MKFLVNDHQLPVALARFLAAQGLACQHVLDVGLERAADRHIWQYALEQALILITKDADFFHLTTRPEAGVQVVWVRLGNCRKHVLLATFSTLLPQLLTALQSGNRLVEVR